MDHHIRPDELSIFSESYLIGAAVQVMPVGEIGEYRFTPGRRALG